MDLAIRQRDAASENAEQQERDRLDSALDEGQGEDEQQNDIPEGALTLEGDGSQLESTVAEGSETVYFALSERSAVAVGAYSPSRHDLQFTLRGAGIDVTADDSLVLLKAFSFTDELFFLDPTLGAVFDAGTYEIELQEYQGREFDFIVELRTSTQVINPGESVDFSWGDNESQLFIASLETGNEVLETSNSTGDPAFWFTMHNSSRIYFNDDGAGIPEARIDFGDEQYDEFGVVDAVVVISSYNRSDPGSSTVTLR